MKTLNKILCILICIVIIIGIVIWKKNGFNLELQYSNRNQINLVKNTGINKSDIEQIASEVFGNTRYVVQEVETFDNIISIVAEEITEEQRDSIIKKFNEKYKMDIKASDIEINSIPFTRVIDVIKPFILPGIITFVIILLYYLLRFKSLGWKIILSKTVIIPVVAELLLYSMIAITRIPFGRVAIGCGIALYVIIIALLTNNFENNREKKKVEQQEQ